MWVEVVVRKSIADGLRDTSTPFVVRNCQQDFPTAESAWEALANEGELSGYVEDVEETRSLNGVLSDWRNGTLNLNVVDHPVSRLSIPLIMREHSSVPLEHLCSYQLTKQGQRVDFHFDPSIGVGIWMYLYQGQKLWWLADLESPIYAAFIGKGDFIYFPVTWKHAVKTIEKTFGLTGYC